MGILSALRRDITGGTAAYKELNAQRNKWVEAQLLAQMPNAPTLVPNYDGGANSISLSPSQQAQLDALAAQGPLYYEVGDSGVAKSAIGTKYDALKAQFEQQQWADYTKAQQLASQLQADWITTLPPDQQQKAAAEFKLHSSDMDTINKYGSTAAKAIIAGVAGGAALTASGAIGAPALTGTDAAMADLASAGGLTPASMAAPAVAPVTEAGGLLGSGGSVAAPVAEAVAAPVSDAAFADMAGGLLPEYGTEAAYTAGLGDSAGWAAAPSLGGVVNPGYASAGSGLLGDAASSLPSAPTSPTSPPSSVPGLTDMLPSNLTDWLSLGSTLGGLVNSLKPAETADIPDYYKLAQQQAEINAAAAAKQTQANRPNQINAAGDTSTWTQDPVTGEWTQKQAYGGANQALFDQANTLKTGLLGQAAANGPLSTSGLPELGGPLMSAQGNSKEIQDAWMNLLRPDLEMNRNSEIQRLKNQGLTEDSPAFQRAMLRLDQANTDAANKALIAGTSEYGNIYNRDLSGRTSQRNDYNTMFGARQTVQDQPYRNLQNLAGTVPGATPSFGSFMSSTGAPGADMYGASQDSYAAMLAQANAKNAASNNLTQGLFGLGSTLGGK